MDRTEVTVRDYTACVKAGRCGASDIQFGCNTPGTGKDDHPQNCVISTDARKFCEWRGGLLPTEQQWEYAARGGAEQRTYPWGESAPTPNSACWENQSGTCRVGSFPAGAFGLQDMAGNVWEWVADVYAPYPGAPSNPDRRPGSDVVVRGGAWGSTTTEIYKVQWSTYVNGGVIGGPRTLRGAYRFKSSGRSKYTGFRCASSI